jgi:hypothetical protein
MMETVLILGGVLVVGLLIFAGAQNQHRRQRYSGGDGGASYSGGDGGCDTGAGGDAGCDGGGGGGGGD